jgi:nuclear factor related to kappa-B-binding protein
MKHSQWLKTKETDPQTLISVIGGALDRLHYEEDSCVKYDAEKKLWVYMHRMRTLDFPEWQTLPSEPQNCL